MAYSKNIKNFVVAFNKKRSGEKIVEYLSKLEWNETGYNMIKKEADSLVIPFTPADWNELKASQPGSKTIRRWAIKTNISGEKEKEQDLSVSVTQARKNDSEGERRIPDKQLNDHWVRLGIIAEKLRIGLEFPNYSEGKVIESRFEGTVWGGWSYDAQHDWKTGKDNPIIIFSAEKEALWSYLIRHMDNEFKSFSRDLKKVKKNAACHVTKNVKDIYSDQTQLRNDVAVKDLRKKLFKVIERGTFQGICPIFESTK